MEGQPAKTNLYGNIVVDKNHPRIRLRGLLDSVHAYGLCVQLQANAQGEMDIADQIGKLLSDIQCLMRGEVRESALPALSILDMDCQQLHHFSHHPPGGHFVPTVSMGELMAMLNYWRTLVRQAEIAAVEAFGKEPDIRMELIDRYNLLSSAIYALMCWHHQQIPAEFVDIP